MNRIVKCQGNPPPSKRFCQALEMALERSQHHKRAGNFEFWTSSWGPPHDEPVWATRQQATTRGGGHLRRVAPDLLPKARLLTRALVKFIRGPIWPLPQGMLPDAPTAVSS